MTTFTPARRPTDLPTLKCIECGKTMQGRLGTYKYDECGLSTVKLTNITIYECSCGAVVPEIPAMAALHRYIAFKLICKHSLLVGEEIRFLRKMANLTGIDLARLLGTHKTNLSKWENDSRKITKKTDGTLRLLCFTGMLQQLIQEQGKGTTFDLPRIADAIKQLSEVDIKHILQRVKSEFTGPRKVVINPEDLAKFSDSPSAPTRGDSERVM
jgi:DNA-binding transcriptional regulator YiaG